ncbi:MAG TPA: hypothetical protein VMH24_06470, partial [Candidatus Sulfotelmatobacter sp.]|nr:hypothetical protein [Candidatus Sulfotelmatobacter sp.]
RGLVAIVDAADLHMVAGVSWTAVSTSRGRWYVNGSDGAGGTVMLHRLLLGLARGDPRQGEHRNGDGLDNRRANLRIATQSQNNANTKKRPSAIHSRFKGVSWHRKGHKWQGHITVDGHARGLGLFVDESDAARAYDQAALAAWGDFALTNERLGLLP